MAAIVVIYRRQLWSKHPWIPASFQDFVATGVYIVEEVLPFIHALEIIPSFLSKRIFNPSSFIHFV